jgi:hypothetical protein
MVKVGKAENTRKCEVQACLKHGKREKASMSKTEEIEAQSQSRKNWRS